MKKNKRYNQLKTAKWISIRQLIPGAYSRSDQLEGECRQELKGFKGLSRVS